MIRLSRRHLRNTDSKNNWCRHVALQRCRRLLLVRRYNMNILILWYVARCATLLHMFLWIYLQDICVFSWCKAFCMTNTVYIYIQPTPWGYVYCLFVMHKEHYMYGCNLQECRSPKFSLLFTSPNLGRKHAAGLNIADESFETLFIINDSIWRNYMTGIWDRFQSEYLIKLNEQCFWHDDCQWMFNAWTRCHACSGIK